MVEQLHSPEGSACGLRPPQKIAHGSVVAGGCMMAGTVFGGDYFFPV